MQYIWTNNVFKTTKTPSSCTIHKLQTLINRIYDLVTYFC